MGDDFCVYSVFMSLGILYITVICVHVIRLFALYTRVMYFIYTIYLDECNNANG